MTTHLRDARLDALPDKILPLVYLGTAHASLAFAFACVAFWPRAVAGFFYHSWMVALVHLVTLGWITLSILGALYIVAPVALRTPLPARRSDYVAYGLLTIGLVGLVAHFWIEEFIGMAWCAALAALGIAYVLGRVSTALWHSRAPAEVKLHIWLAAANFLGAATAGTMLAFDKTYHFLPGFVLTNVFAHAHLAAIGWASMMAVGVAYRLLPMVLPARPPSGRIVAASAVLLELGVIVLFAGLVTQSGWAVGGGVLIAAGFACFFGQVRVMATHPRPRPVGTATTDYAVRHAISAGIWLMAATVMGLVLLIVPTSERSLRLATAYGVAGLIGFLSQLILGMEIRLLPMYAWYRRFAETDFKGPVPAPPTMGSQSIRRVVFYAWTAGVPLLAAGFFLDSAMVVGAAAWALFGGVVLAAFNGVLVTTARETPAVQRPDTAPVRRVFVPFFIGSLVLTLTWGTTLGMINLARLTAGWGLGALPPSSVWAHAYVQVFGFMALFIMGVAYHVLPRFVGGTLQRARLVPWTFRLQLAGVVLIATGFFLGAPFSRTLWIAGSTALLAASIMFCAVIFGTLASGAAAPEPFRRWVVAGASWLAISSALALTAAGADDITWHRVLWTAALFGFINSWIFGVGRRILPIFLGCRPRWIKGEPAVFILYQLGTAAWVIGAWPVPGLDLVRAVGAVLLIASVVGYTACLGLFSRIGPVLGSAVWSPHDGWQRYVFAAWGWLFAALALGPGGTVITLLTGGGESILVVDFARHAMAFGFAAQMMLGVASRVVPNFTGEPLWSPSARDAAFHLLNASMALRALEVPVGLGLWPQSWSYIAWSGPLGVAAVVLFAMNMFMTIRQSQSALIQPAVAPHAVQAALTARK